MLIRETYNTDKKPWVIYLMMGFLIFVVHVLILYRQHYSIDVIVGFFYGLWIILMCERIAPTLDSFFNRVGRALIRRYRRYQLEAAEGRREVQDTQSKRIGNRDGMVESRVLLTNSEYANKASYQ